MLPLLVALATASVFVLDPTVTDPTRIWHIDPEPPGAEIQAALEQRGLAAAALGQGAGVNVAARDLVLGRVLERVNEAYRRAPDGSPVPGASFDLTFAVEAPAGPRYDRGPGYDYSRICIDGRRRRCGGTLGVELYDPGNRHVEWQCDPGRLGVFAGRICGLRSRLDPPLRASDRRFVDGSYAIGDGTAADDGRFLEVRTAIEDWGTALGNVTAHEIGHALGLPHDRSSGSIMRARFATEDLSDGSLALSRSAQRTLAQDVGYAARPGTGTGGVHLGLALDHETTIGALTARAAAVVEIDPTGRAVATVSGDAAARGLAEGDLARLALEAATPGAVEPLEAAASRAGFLFVLPEGERPHFVPAAEAPVRAAIGRRIAACGRPEERRHLVESLLHFHPRIATDAALDLERTAGPAATDEASFVERALLSNAGTFEDLRPLIRLAGRAGARSCAERIVDLVAGEDGLGRDEDRDGPDLVPVAAEALSRLEGGDRLAARLQATRDGPARAALTRTLLAMPGTSIAERVGFLADANAAIARAAAWSLLTEGVAGRTAFRAALPRLDPPRRQELSHLLRRPRP